MESKPLPPLLIHVGGAERVRDDGIFFYSKFKTSPIRLEIYEDMVHVFQLFTAFSAFSKHSVNRMGNFLFQHTGSTESTILQRQCVHVKNTSGFPMEVVYDAAGVLRDGIEMLVERGLYQIEERDDALVVNYAIAHK